MAAPSTAKTVVVVGATCNEGFLAHLLKSSNNKWNVIVVTHSASDAKAQVLQTMGCTLAVADVHSKESLVALFKGVSTDVYACLLASKGEVASDRNILDAVVADGRCDHFVATLVSTLSDERGADSSDTFRMPQLCFQARPKSRAKHAIEQQIIEVKLPYTIVRPGVCIENWLTFADKGMGIQVDKSGITVPFLAPAGVPVPFVTYEDIGGVVAGVLNNSTKYIAMQEVPAVSQVATGAEVAQIFAEHYGLSATYAPSPLCLLGLFIAEPLVHSAYFVPDITDKSDSPANTKLSQVVEETRDVHPQRIDLAQWLRTNPLPALDEAVERQIWGIF